CASAGAANASSIRARHAYAVWIEDRTIAGSIAVDVGIKPGLRGDGLTGLRDEGSVELISVQKTFEHGVFNASLGQVVRPRHRELVADIQGRVSTILTEVEAIL